MRLALIAVLAAIACHGQIEVKYSLQPSGVFRSLAGRQLPARTALYEAVACADADAILDEGRLLHAAPFSTVSQAAALTLRESRSKAAVAWRVASLVLPLAFGGVAAARLGTEVLASVGGGAALTGIVNSIRTEKEAVPNVGAWVGSDVLMLGAGRCVTRLMLGEFPPRGPMPARVTIGATGKDLQVQPSSQGRNSGEGPPAAVPLVAGSPATMRHWHFPLVAMSLAASFEIPVEWRGR